MPGGPGRRQGRRSGARSGPNVAEATPITATDDYPEVVLEWMPDAKPGDADGTWVTMTPYLAAGSCKRGRKYELDRFVAGTMSVTLRASTRLFDPEYTAGTYYGKLLPMKQIRLRAKWAGVWYPVWRGFVTSWGTTVLQDVVWSTTITCRGPFERLERIRLPSSAWALEVQRDNPSLWFRLGETDTARVTDSSAGGNYGIFDNVTQGADGLVPDDADGAVTVGHTTDARVTIQNPRLIAGYPFSISAMIKTSATNPSYFKTIFGALKTPRSLSVDSLLVELQQNTMVLRSRLDATSGGGRYVTGTTRLDDGKPHHVTVVYSTAASHTVYVDGVAEGSVTAAGSPTWWTGPQNVYTIGNLEDTGLGDYGFDGTVDEVLVFPIGLAASRVAAHALAAKTGWNGDDTGARVTRFLNAINWPAELRDIGAGISILGPANWSAGDAALAALQAWADTELGAFFEGKDGKLVWRSRHYPLLNTNATRSQATFSDSSTSSLQYLRDGFSLLRDETMIRNPVTASRRGGISVTVRDDNLADNYFGDRTYPSPTTEDQKDSTVRDRAIWIRERYKNLSTRLASMKVKPRKNPTVMWPTVFGLELGDRITVQHTPGGIGNQISLDQIVESVAHDFSPTAWTTAFEGSPVDTNVGNYLILDDAVSGLLDTGLNAY